MARRPSLQYGNNGNIGLEYACPIVVLSGDGGGGGGGGGLWWLGTYHRLVTFHVSVASS